MKTISVTDIILISITVALDVIGFIFLFKALMTEVYDSNKKEKRIVLCFLFELLSICFSIIFCIRRFI